jgi:hypothetical protein
MVLRSERTIWLVIVAPAAICAAAMQINFVLVRQACSMQRNVALYLVTLVALALMAFVALVAFMTWWHAGGEWPGETADATTRTRFISMLGLLGSGMFFLVTLAQGIATIRFDPCQL